MTTSQCHQDYQGESAWHPGSTKQPTEGALRTDKAFWKYSLLKSCIMKSKWAQGKERLILTNRTAWAKAARGHTRKLKNIP